MLRGIQHPPDFPSNRLEHRLRTRAVLRTVPGLRCALPFASGTVASRVRQLIGQSSGRKSGQQKRGRGAPSSCSRTRRLLASVVPALLAGAGIRGRHGRERVQHSNNEGLHNITFCSASRRASLPTGSRDKAPGPLLLHCRYMMWADSASAAFGCPASTVKFGNGPQVINFIYECVG